MRPYLLLITAALGLAFVAGYFSLTIWTEPPAPRELAVRIPELKAKFAREQRAAATLNLSSFLADKNRGELLDPELTLPQSHRFPLLELRALRAHAKTCSGAPAVKNAELKKTLAWQEFVCGKRQLPADFFSKPPYMHPGGESYARLYWKKTNDAAWRDQHRDLFHVTEDSNIAELQGLGPEALAALRANEETVLAPKFVFLREGASSRGNGGEYQYKAYAVAAWNRFLEATPFTAIAVPIDEPCLFREGHVCWQIQTRSLYRTAAISSWLLLAGSIFATGVTAFLLLQRIRSQKQDEERKRFALRMLTHELRTPIASLVFGIENQKSKPSSETLARLEDDVRRLQKLAETSRQYLQTVDGKGLFKPEPRKIPSLHAWLKEEFASNDFSVEGTDCTASLDPYWTALCLKNVIENAQKHGTAPVTVRIDKSGPQIVFEIQDAGQAAFQPGSRGYRSSGLGLGLAIVQQTISQLGGRLEFHFQPTRVRITLPETAS